MINFIVGFVMVVFSLVYSIFEDYFDPAVGLLLMGIGIWLIIKGANQIITNRKTDVNGLDTYGCVLKTFTTGNSINDLPETKAQILTYLENEKTTKVFEEVVGFGSTEYNIGTFVRLKQFENDINVIEAVTRDLIPDYILEELDPHINKLMPQTTDIAGVKYIRADLVKSTYIEEEV